MTLVRSDSNLYWHGIFVTLLVSMIINIYATELSEYEFECDYSQSEILVFIIYIKNTSTNKFKLVL